MANSRARRARFSLVDSNQTFHKNRDSLLSSASGYTNYRGVLNLCVVLLVMSTGRLVLENLLKYGFLVRFSLPLEFVKDPTAWPSFLAVICVNIFILNALKLERKLEKGKLTEQLGLLLGMGNVFLLLLLPAIYLWYRKANPVSAFWALTIYTCTSFKLISYLFVNRAHREIRRQERKEKEANEINNNESHKNLNHVNEKNNADKETKEAELNLTQFQSDQQNLVKYPDNLNYKDLYYFMFAPTFCYEINFPRSPKIRKSFLLRRLVEMAFLLTLQFILIQQWIIPILQNSQNPFRESNSLKIIERLLKLAVPNHVCWLIGFYCFFHSYLNFLSEVLRFADREFYRDWWNAEDVSAFWQAWNIPVHNFCLRHIYKPLLSIGVTKFQASLFVFFVSAFFHEYLVSIPLRMFRLWSFFGMLMQIPFSFVVKKFLNGNYGNMAVWISLIIGQPIAIMMYIHDYYIDYFKNQS